MHLFSEISSERMCAGCPSGGCSVLPGCVPFFLALFFFLFWFFFAPLPLPIWWSSQIRRLRSRPIPILFFFFPFPFKRPIGPCCSRSPPRSLASLAQPPPLQCTLPPCSAKVDCFAVATPFFLFLDLSSPPLLLPKLFFSLVILFPSLCHVLLQLTSGLVMQCLGAYNLDLTTTHSGA